MTIKKNRMLRLALCVDAFFNVLLFNGSEKHHISGRVGCKVLFDCLKRWLYLASFIDFFFGKDHCFNAIEIEFFRK